MSKSIYSIVPDPETLFALEPEELAGVVLESFNSAGESLKLNRHDFGLYYTVNQYPQEYWPKLLRALMEAWVWLEREGLIAPDPDQEGWYFVTRRGKQLTQATDLAAYRKANMLPKKILHPLIAQKVWATFLRGDYDTAVFQAFKEVEVAVRVAGGFGEQDLGTGLMRKAFHVDTGPLTDPNLVFAEREALSNLFAGAIGSYKNPHSHRNVTLDATEAVEMIMLASHLLKIVDARSGRAAS